MPLSAERLGSLEALGCHHGGAAADAALGPSMLETALGVFADRVDAELREDFTTR